MLIGTAVLGVLALAIAAGAWHLDGGRWFVVATPSMGQQLPVGSLVLTTPTTAAEVTPGEVITFRSPGSETVYTHRAVTVTDQDIDKGINQGIDKGIETRGDINAAADPWTVRDEDLIGSLAWQAPALGWLVRGLPMFFAGLAVVWVLTTRLAPGRRYSWRLVGFSTSLALTMFVLKPWIGLERLNQRNPEQGPGVLVDVVSTGLLPIRALEADGADGADGVSLVNGQVDTLHLTGGAETGAYDVLTRLDLSVGWWIALVTFCLLPTIWSLLVGLAPRDPHDPDEASEPAALAVVGAS